MSGVKILKKKCEGHWPEIIAILAPHLIPAINNRPNHVPCQFHENSKDGLRCFPDFDESGGMICNTCGSFPDGIAVLKCANDWSFSECLAKIKIALEKVAAKDIDFNGLITAETENLIISQHDSEKREENLLTLREQLIPLDSQQAETGRLYLKNRGLTLESIPDNLLFHPGLKYYCKGIYNNYPALVALIANLDDEYASMLRIYITNDGQKAPIPSPKKIMPPVYPGATKGLAIQLYKVTDKLAIAEGVETAIAVHQATGIPAWAAVSAYGMKHVQIPDSVKEVSIWCDKDKSLAGEQAGQHLAKRMIDAGKAVKLMIPEDPIPLGRKGIDWLDVLVKD